MKIIRYWLVLAVGVFIAAFLFPGIEFDNNWVSLLLVAFLLGLFNLVLKPLLIFFTLPFVVLSLGVGIWLINAVLLYWAASLVSGFTITSFWSALGGALVISLVNMGYSMITRPRRSRRIQIRTWRSGNSRDIIDI